MKIAPLYAICAWWMPAGLPGVSGPVLPALCAQDDCGKTNISNSAAMNFRGIAGR
jgi:hypothetical protein